MTVFFSHSTGAMMGGSVPMNPILPPVPVAPVVGSLVTRTQHTLQIYWTRMSGVTSFYVYLGDTRVATVLGSDTTYTYTGLSAGTTYRMSIEAVNEIGEVSPRSNEVSSSTTAPTTPEPEPDPIDPGTNYGGDIIMGGASVPYPDSDLSMRCLPASQWNANTLFGTGGLLRTLADRAVGIVTDDSNFGVFRRLPFAYSTSWTSFPNTTEYKNTGQNKIERGQFNNVYDMRWHARLTKDIRAIDRISDVLRRMLDTVDMRGSPVSHSKSSELNSSRTNYAGIVYGVDGAGRWVERAGSRVGLEIGLGMSTFMSGAHALWANYGIPSPKNENYLLVANRVRAHVKNHVIPDWRQYWNYKRDDRNDTRPLAVRRNFAHADLCEMDGFMKLALIETGMYKAGLRTAYTITNPMGDRETVGLDPSTSSDVTTHSAWKQASLAFKNWYNSTQSSRLITTSQFRDADMVKYGPALVWGQLNISMKNVSGQFTAMNTYSNYSLNALWDLWAYGLIRHALGSQRAADDVMLQLVSTINSGLFPKARVNNKEMAINLVGGINSSRESLSYTVNPFGGAVSESHYEVGVVRTKTVGIHSCFDTSNRINDLMVLYDSGNSGSPSCIYARLMNEVYKNGRKA